ncbi:hypothetical protein GCM10009827_094490 [Dactylosporangium maewongense]|uniref:Ricin B lectin domain-containing protein n=1 Tax=Dactylosporangium maewongense TaxID=634393 RepID=A0ABN2CIR4_9ACTN
MSPFADAFTRRPTVPRRGFIPAPRVFVVSGVVLAVAALPFILPSGPAADAGRTAGPGFVPRPAAVTSTSATPPAPTAGPAASSSSTPPGGSGGNGSAGPGPGSGGSGSGVGAGGSGAGGSGAGGSGSGGTATGAQAGVTTTTAAAPAKTTAKAAAPPPSIPGRAIVGVQSRLCLSAAAGKDGTALVIATCNGSAAQHWETLPDGTIRSVSLCMDAAWAGTDVYTVVQVAYCSGNRAQQWRLNASNDLVNVNADKCADVIERRTTTGSPVKLYWCNGQDNQKWFWR